MEVRSNMLYDLDDSGDELSRQRIEAMKSIYQSLGIPIEPVPPELEHAAKQILQGRSWAYVARHSGGQLSKWAAAKRKERRKAEREARKRNRR